MSESGLYRLIYFHKLWAGSHSRPGPGGERYALALVVYLFYMDEQQVIQMSAKVVVARIYRLCTSLLFALGLAAGAVLWPVVAAIFGQEFISISEKEEILQRRDHSSL